jgi:hypothetical protein
MLSEHLCWEFCDIILFFCFFSQVSHPFFTSFFSLFHGSIDPIETFWDDPLNSSAGMRSIRNASFKLTCCFNAAKLFGP